jgi:putative protease
MSSRDLRGLDYLEQFIEGEIDSLKIEGRMRSHLYVGTIVQNYASALEHMKQKEDISTEKMMVDKWKRELTKVSHRDYCSGNLVQRADEDSIYYDRESGEKEYALAGNILEVSPSKNTMIMEVRYGFNSGEKLEVLPFKGDFIRLPSDNIQNLLGEKLTRTKPGTLVRLPYNEGIDPLNIVRVKVSGETNDRK